MTYHRSEQQVRAVVIQHVLDQCRGGSAARRRRPAAVVPVCHVPRRPAAIEGAPCVVHVLPRSRRAPAAAGRAAGHSARVLAAIDDDVEGRRPVGTMDGMHGVVSCE